VTVIPSFTKGGVRGGLAVFRTTKNSSAPFGFATGSLQPATLLKFKFHKKYRDARIGRLCKNKYQIKKPPRPDFGTPLLCERRGTEPEKITVPAKGFLCRSEG